jgi:hypothetical protein
MRDEAVGAQSCLRCREDKGSPATTEHLEVGLDRLAEEPELSEGDQSSREGTRV